MYGYNKPATANSCAQTWNTPLFLDWLNAFTPLQKRFWLTGVSFLSVVHNEVF
jgi:hypothetical protein